MDRWEFEHDALRVQVEPEAASPQSATSVSRRYTSIGAPFYGCVAMVPDQLYCACARAALLMLCAVQVLARSPRAADVPVVQCVANNCSAPCPTMLPFCPSGIIRNCGCCDVCWIRLGEDEECNPPVPENKICGSYMWCNPEGYCEAIPLSENTSGK